VWFPSLIGRLKPKLAALVLAQFEEFPSLIGRLKLPAPQAGMVLMASFHPS